MWAINKLCHVGPIHYRIADGWPYRTTPWLELLGPEVVASAEYGHFDYSDIVVFESAQRISSETRWSDLMENGPWGQLLLEPNRHLEQGKPLKDWLPDLPVTYHLPMTVPEDEAERGAHFLRELPRPITGISCASYRGSEAWKTWGYKEWSPFLKRLHAEVGGSIVMLGGGWDDLTDRIAEQDGYRNLVGRTSMGSLVSVLRHCEHVVGFSSGLGMLHTAEWGKTFLLWPDHQVALSTSWADPAMLDAGTYATSLWRDPDEVWWRVQKWLRVPAHRERAGFQR